MSKAEKRMRVPQMLGLEALTRIIVAYLMVGADEKEADYETVANVADVSSDNVGRNARFFEYIGLIVGGRGKFKLTELGKSYAQALSWGRIKDAGAILRKTLSNNELVSRVLGYVDINAPVSKEDLISRIAIIAGVRPSPSYRTGIGGFIDMLISAGLFNEDSAGNLTPSKVSTVGPKEVVPLPEETTPLEPPTFKVPINITINLNTDKIDAETLKQLLKTIREALSEPT